MNLVRGQMLEPRSCGVGEVERKVADDHGVVRCAAQLACQAVVVEPDRGVGLS